MSPTQQQLEAQQQFLARLQNDLSLAAQTFASDEVSMGELRERVRKAMELVTVFKPLPAEKDPGPMPVLASDGEPPRTNKPRRRVRSTKKAK